LDFAHGRVENKADTKHDQDVGKNRRAFKEPLRVDQCAPIPPPPATISAVKVVISPIGTAMRKVVKMRG
jgi:hypothetical protein